MATLPLATLLTVLDSVAKGAAIFATAVGTGSEATTVSKGAANNLATLQAVADSDVQADLIAVFAARAANVTTAVLNRALVGAPLQRALDRHYGASDGSLNGFLTAQDARVHPFLRDIGFQIDAVNAFPPTVVDPVATFTVTGAGAGTFVAGTGIDTSLYGKAHMVVRTTTLIGASDIVATLTMTRLDGGTDTQEVTIPAGTASGTDVDIGDATDRYVGCTGITLTGGTAADAFKIVSAVERTIAL